MQITFSDTEVKSIQSCYHLYVLSQQARNLTMQEETFYQETLHLFLQHDLPVSAVLVDTLSITLTCSPAQWRSLRTAVIKELAVYISIRANMMATHYSGILEKLNAHELAAYVEEAVENETVS